MCYLPSSPQNIASQATAAALGNAAKLNPAAAPIFNAQKNVLPGIVKNLSPAALLPKQTPAATPGDGTTPPPDGPGIFSMLSLPRIGVDQLKAGGQVAGTAAPVVPRLVMPGYQLLGQAPNQYGQTLPKIAQGPYSMPFPLVR